jgi:DNA-binding NtrC family response regulator
VSGPAPRYHVELDEARRAIIRRALRDSGGNRRLAAERLGVSRESLHGMMRRLGLSARAPR